MGDIGQKQNKPFITTGGNPTVNVKDGDVEYRKDLGGTFSYRASVGLWLGDLDRIIVPYYLGSANNLPKPQTNYVTHGYGANPMVSNSIFIEGVYWVTLVQTTLDATNTWAMTVNISDTANASTALTPGYTIHVDSGPNVWGKHYVPVQAAYTVAQCAAFYCLASSVNNPGNLFYTPIYILYRTVAA